MNKKSKSKSCKNRTGNRSYTKNDEYGKTSREPHNDVGWYAANSDLIRDTGSLAFPYSLGSVIDQSDLQPDDWPGLPVTDFKFLKMAQPGIMTFTTLAGPGRSIDATSAANIAANNIYAFVRYANSGSRNYDPQDIMLYLLAMDECYMWFSNIVRIYGVMRTYSLKNKYMPRVYAKALGFDFDNLNKNLAQLRVIIETFALKVNAFAVPGGLSYFARHIWLYQHLWKDNDSPRAQVYAFKPYCYRVYDETSVPTGGQLVAHDIDYDTPMTVDDIASICDAIINPLSYSEDAGIMSGDILKAFGSNIVRLIVPDMNYYVEPVFNSTHEVLDQIHNAVCVYNGIWNSIDPDITQDPSNNYLVYDPGTYSTNDFDLMLDMQEDYPDPGRVMEATRFMACSSGDDYTMGSEAITRMDVYSYGMNYDSVEDEWYLDIIQQQIPQYMRIVNNMDGDKFTTSSHFSMGEGDAEKIANNRDNLIKMMALLEPFDAHPCMQVNTLNVYRYPEDDEMVVWGDPYHSCTPRLWETTNVTKVTLGTLKRLHETALFSMFSVPDMGTFAMGKGN